MSNKSSLHGKPWTVVSTHNTFDSADQKRNALSDKEGLEVKVRRSSSGTFTVRTRSLVAEEESKKDTKPKGKPRSKSEKRKLREQKKRQKKST